jgi:hypothetical protein
MDEQWPDPDLLEYSASLAERFAERTAAKVASARTSVPPAVAIDATVVQSTTAEAYGEVPARCTLSTSMGVWRKSASRPASSSERLIAHSGRSVTHIENRT